MDNRVDYKELLKEQLRKAADQVDAVDSTEAAYIAGRLDALLATKQTRAAVNQQAEQ